MGHSLVGCSLVLVGRSCGTVLSVALVGDSCWKILPHVKSLKGTLVGQSCTVLWEPSYERFVRDVLPKSNVKRQVALCTRRPSKKSLVQPPKRPPRKRAFRMRRPPKVKWEAPSERTHQAALPSAPLNTTAADTPPNVATSRFPAPATKIQLRLPRKVTT